MTQRGKHRLPDPGQHRAPGGRRSYRLTVAGTAAVVGLVLAGTGVADAATTATVGTGGGPLKVRSAAALTAPVVAPVLIVIWSGAFWANEAGVRRAVHWTSDVLLALALGGLCVLIAVPILARRRPRLWLTVFAAVVNLVFLAAAYFVGSMAISSVWM